MMMISLSEINKSLLTSIFCYFFFSETANFIKLWRIDNLLPKSGGQSDVQNPQVFLNQKSLKIITFFLSHNNVFIPTSVLPKSMWQSLLLIKLLYSVL